MARSLTDGMVTAVTGATLRPAFLFEGDFDSGALRLWSGVGELIWDSKTWTGAGNLLSIAPIEETSEIRAAGVQLELSGVPASILDLVEGEDYQGRTVRIWFACLEATGAAIADPVELFRGRADVMEEEDDGETATIRLSAEHILIDLERPVERRYTDEDQRGAYPGDRFFEFVADLQEREIVGKS